MVVVITKSMSEQALISNIRVLHGKRPSLKIVISHRRSADDGHKSVFMAHSLAARTLQVAKTRSSYLTEAYMSPGKLNFPVGHYMFAMANKAISP
jgi:hypothetical protein